MKTSFDSLDVQGKRELISGIIETTISNFLYYDRKNCELLSVDDLENALREKIITEEEIIELFKEHLEHNLV